MKLSKTQQDALNKLKAEYDTYGDRRWFSAFDLGHRESTLSALHYQGFTRRKPYDLYQFKPRAS